MQKVTVRPFLISFTLAILGAVLAQPVTVTDYLDRQVQLPEPASRIVSLMPSHTETVLALGAGHLLVGIDEASPEPAGLDLPRLGNGFNASLELIVSLEPDLVMVDAFSGVHLQLEELGIVTFAGTPETLSDVFTFVATAGSLTGFIKEAEDLNRRMRAAVDRVAERTEGLERPRVYLELDPTPFSAGPGSYADDLLRIAGGSNVVPEELGAWPMLSPEFVVASEPDFVVLLDAPFGETEQSFRARPGFAGMEATVIEVDAVTGDLLSRPGPGLEAAVEWLFSVLHGDAAGE